MVAELPKTKKRRKPDLASRTPVERAKPTSSIDPALLSSDLQYQWERVRAIVLADKFEKRLIELATSDNGPGVSADFEDWLKDTPRLFGNNRPLDRAIAIGRLIAEAMILNRLKYRDLFGKVDEREDDWEPRTHSEATAVGLTIKTIRRARRKRSDPNLPGCQGYGLDGKPCKLLRCYGHRYCPKCESEEGEWVLEKE